MLTRNIYIDQEHLYWPGTFIFDQEHLYWPGTFILTRNIYIDKEHLCRTGTCQSQVSQIGIKHLTPVIQMSTASGSIRIRSLSQMIIPDHRRQRKWRIQKSRGLSKTRSRGLFCCMSLSFN